VQEVTSKTWVLILKSYKDRNKKKGKKTMGLYCIMNYWDPEEEVAI
jgi:hypothetical protein